MALLNPPDILPEAMRYLVRALLALRQPHADRDELIGLVAPRGLTEAMDSLIADAADTAEAEPDDLRTGGTVIAGASLDALRSLGIVEQDGSRIALSAAAATQWKKPADVTAQGMCRRLLEAALQAANPEAPYGETSGSTDLMQAVVLLHSAEQPLWPFDRLESGRAVRPGDRAFAEWQSTCCGPDRTKTWPVPNREQWLSFRRWAPYLGLARPVGTNGLIPDASDALIRRLPELAPGDYHIRDFLGRCADAVPILDGGTFWLGQGSPAHGEPSVLSGGLSVSLMQLEADGFMSMPRPESDIGRDGRILRIRPDRSADRRVTTVIWHTTPIRRGAR
jgi:hypothetical protein